MQDASGEISHWLVIQRPVGEQRAREEQMRMLLAAVDHANDFVLIMSRDQAGEREGRIIVYTNETYLKSTGFSRDEVIG